MADKCVAKCKNCNVSKTKKGCGYRYTAKDADLWNCPKCGTDRKCERYQVQGYNVCGVHGAGWPKARGKLAGRKPKQIEPPRPRGKYSPARLLEKLDLLWGDPDYLALRSEISLLDARIAEVAEKLEVQPHLNFDHLGMLVINMRKDKVPENFVQSLEQVLTEAKAEWKAWEHITMLIEQRRKLAVSEKQRLMDMNQMITTGEVVKILSVLQLTLRKNLVIGDTITSETLEAIRVGLVNALEGRVDGRDSERHPALPAPQV